MLERQLFTGCFFFSTGTIQDVIHTSANVQCFKIHMKNCTKDAGKLHAEGKGGETERQKINVENAKD